MSQNPLLYDWAGKPISASAAPITSRPAQSLASPQGGALVLGSDYAAAAAAQVPKVDTGGNLFTVAQGVSQSTGLPVPFAVDATGATVIRNALAATIAYSPTTAVSTTANAGKHMLSVYNASTTMYQRVLGFYAMCPPQAAVSGGLLGTNSTYTTVGMATYRFTTAHTGGTLLTGVQHDTRDTYDSGFTCRVGATITGTLSQSLYTFDAANSALASYGHREDAGVKVWTMAPGEGITFQCISAVGGSGVNFYLRIVCAQNTA
ncbi:MAG: hypothetical protein EOO40_00305 [Deltaproteobacteria bacterium]|nr:MAG: hypothetical protein EOO40_00305 [Deltaproteobacteria bacterium]